MTPLWGMDRQSRSIHPSARRVARPSKRDHQGLRHHGLLGVSAPSSGFHRRRFMMNGTWT